MANMDDFGGNEDGWSDDEEANDEFPVPSNTKDKPIDAPSDDEKLPPSFSKSSAGNKTIFVTTQFRFFQDDYCIVQQIGEPGQFGIAYECYKNSDPNKTRRCVKEINKARFHHIGHEERNKILATMQNEIAILKKIDHPNIVKLYDVYEDRHKLQLVMEFLPGGELFARICEKESFSEKEAAAVLKQILEALNHMHDKNILHLDLKPDNIIFASKADDSEVKLIDFGMARVVPRLAKLKDRVGTPNYMAPEVLDGKYSKAADVWSCGVILFCCLFGFPPFYADSDIVHLDENTQLEQAIKKGFQAEVLEGFGPWFPEDIPVSDNCRYVLGKMLETDVVKRWTVSECLTSQWVRGFASEKSIPPIVRGALKKFHQTTKFKAAISNLFINNIDPDHIEEMKKFFADLDVNGDGVVSLQEFKNGMQTQFNTELDDQQLEAIFNNVDTNNNKTISFDELLSITAHRMLIDEDERLYQAFQDLDEDGNGLISKIELEQAMSKFDNKQNQKRESRILHKRFASAFDTADINGDGEIDYEEFLKLLHPDFGHNQTMNDFKYDVGDTGRVRAAQWNVDHVIAEDAVFMEPVLSPKKEEKPDNKKMKTMSINSFKKNNKKILNVIQENNKQKEEKENEKINDIENEYKEKINKLNDKINKLEKDRELIRNKYDKQIIEMLNKFESHQKTVKQKDQLILDKDTLITQLNILLDSRNNVITKQKNEIKKNKEVIKKKDGELNSVQLVLQHAIESKMKSLQQSQSEIAKLKNRNLK